ncbi:amidohydrolase [Curtobacterium sp. MCBD17_019]|uniref:amidohydrolase n=1 Tax=Curtobacterium sp. MCBD17_019 TaxID=2175669 RepID=UPI001C653F8D|nr:amidohydrolase family protein [Curtobacterium sp. MCBD17_019]
MTGTLIRHVRRIGTAGASADVLVREGRIAAVAPAGVIESTTPTADLEDVVDADGAWLGPGLWDHHTHFDQWALVRRRVDVSACTSAAGVAAVIADAARSASPDDVLIGYGFRDGLWPDAAHRDLLDRAAPGLPVVVVSGDLHAVWCNGIALARYGDLLDRPLVTHPTGLLREQDAFDVSTAISRVPDAVLDDYVADAVEAASGRGVVGVVDLEMRFGLDRWTRRVRAGIDGIRVRSGVYPQELDAVLDRGLRTGDVVPGTLGLVTMGPFKVITDGSLNTRTAAVDEPYAGLHGHDALGVLAFTPDEVRALVRRAADGGLVPAVHAIGDRANALALDVFEQVGVRGSIEHAQLLRPADVARFARLGVDASVQPEHAMDDRDVADRYWAGRTDRAFVLRTLREAGARLRLGSDAPVAPLDPWVSMAAAVGRDRDGREAWHPEQRIDQLTAWTASTDGRTTVAVGDVADLVLVASDPLAASSGALRSMRVLGTAVAGRWTYLDR